MPGIDPISETLGRIDGKLDGVRDDLTDVKQKISTIFEDGCPRGKSNSQRIKAVEGDFKEYRRPDVQSSRLVQPSQSSIPTGLSRKVIAAGVGAVATICAVVVALVEIIQKLLSQ